MRSLSDIAREIALKQHLGGSYCNNKTFYPDPPLRFQQLEDVPEHPRAVVILGRPTQDVIDVTSAHQLRKPYIAGQRKQIGSALYVYLKERLPQDVFCLDISLTRDKNGLVEQDHLQFWRPVIQELITKHIPRDQIYILVGEDTEELNLGPNQLSYNTVYPHIVNGQFQLQENKLEDEIMSTIDAVGEEASL